MFLILGSESGSLERNKQTKLVESKDETSFCESSGILPPCYWICVTLISDL